jgi:hypothetical protein
MIEYFSKTLDSPVTEESLKTLTPQQHCDLKAELQYQIAVLQLFLSQVRLSYHDSVKG